MAGNASIMEFLLGVAPVMREIAAYAGSIVRTGSVHRSFYQAFVGLTKESPWRYGGRLTGFLLPSGPIDKVSFSRQTEVLVAVCLPDGRLATATSKKCRTGSEDLVKIWNLGTFECEGVLCDPRLTEQRVLCMTVVEGPVAQMPKKPYPKPGFFVAEEAQRWAKEQEEDSVRHIHSLTPPPKMKATEARQELVDFCAMQGNWLACVSSYVLSNSELAHY